MIKDDIQQAIYTNLKAKNETATKVLRFILSQIKYEEINKQKDLTDEEVIAVLQKEMKKRKESIEMYKKSGRQDIVDDETKQIEIIEQYTPKQMSEEEVKKVIDDIVPAGSDMAAMGKVIGMVMGKLKGKADGSIVARLVKEKLS